MTAVNYIIDSLEKTPVILNNLLDQIPEENIILRRVENKWSIHEQVCHLVDAQQILIDRFQQFENEKNPLIKSYVPPVGRSSDYYMEMDLDEQLVNFPNIRSKMIQKLKSYDLAYWNLKGQHEVFAPYNTKILLTHCLNVDYSHLFSIEQLGLTKSGFENEIMTFL